MTTSAASPDLFNALAARYQAYPDRRGWIHVPCPFCGKDEGSRRKPTHFGFSERGYKCLVCGAGGSLFKLAEQLDVHATSSVRPVQRPIAPPKPRYWQQNPAAYLDAYLAHPERLPLWTAYKPLAIETIARWQLGVGVLPASACQHRRLIYPVIVHGKIVGFRGRAIACDCPKWLTAGGSETVLWGLELVKAGVPAIVVENPCDAMLAMQIEPGVIAVASTAGCSTWRDEWTAELARRRPSRVIVWLDHDLAGNGSAYHYAEMVAAWRRKNPQATQPPEPNGPKIVNRLLEAGIRASLYRWPEGTPPKADVAWQLQQWLEVAA